MCTVSKKGHFYEKSAQTDGFKKKLLTDLTSARTLKVVITKSYYDRQIFT